MFEMMNQQALSVGAGRRHELAVATMREARLSNGGGARQTVGLALVSIGQRFAGETPARRVSRAEGDCT
jgi:hypothetical protein